MSNDTGLINGLVEKIHQFLSHQIESNSELSEAAKESLTVANECIEQAYKIQRKPASRDLLDIYKSHNETTNHQTQAGSGLGANPAQFIQNLASSILSQATTSTSAPGSTTAASASAPSPSPAPTMPPKVRKRASESEKMAAESFKNQGNDFMRQDKYKEAFDCYTQAINIDENNAIYFSNRAAASSKLGDHQAALRDCQEAVEIDSTYSKAYGRMGLAYASLEDHQNAKEAYVKAVELDPHNESYRNNLKIAEEKLGEGGTNVGVGGGGGSGQNGNMMSMLRSMMSNPEVMQMAMRSLQDPRMQNLFGMGAQSPAAPTTPSAQTDQQQTGPTDQQQTRSTTGQQQTESSNTQSSNTQSEPSVNPTDLFNLTSRLAGSANIDLVGAGQQLLSSIEQNNPDLVNNMRRMMNQAFMPPNPNPNNSDRNPPPGYS